MTTRLVMLQSVPGPDDSQALPLYVDQTGEVAQQDFWRGDPAGVAGFTDRFDQEEITVAFGDFWADPSVAVGKYVVLTDLRGHLRNNVAVIERAEVVVDTDVLPRPEPLRVPGED